MTALGMSKVTQIPSTFARRELLRGESECLFVTLSDLNHCTRFEEFWFRDRLNPGLAYRGKGRRSKLRAEASYQNNIEYQCQPSTHFHYRDRILDTIQRASWKIIFALC